MQYLHKGVIADNTVGGGMYPERRASITLDLLDRIPQLNFLKITTQMGGYRAHIICVTTVKRKYLAHNMCPEFVLGVNLFPLVVVSRTKTTGYRMFGIRSGHEQLYRLMMQMSCSFMTDSYMECLLSSGYVSEHISILSKYLVTLIPSTCNMLAADHVNAIFEVSPDELVCNVDASGHIVLPESYIETIAPELCIRDMSTTLHSPVGPLCLLDIFEGIGILKVPTIFMEAFDHVQVPNFVHFSDYWRDAIVEFIMTTDACICEGVICRWTKEGTWFNPYLKHIEDSSGDEGTWTAMENLSSNLYSLGGDLGYVSMEISMDTSYNVYIDVSNGGYPTRYGVDLKLDFFIFPPNLMC